MSNDQDKTRGITGDQPILLGTPNDPKLIGKVDLFTGAGLDNAIAKLDAFVGGAFTETSDEDPFPFGIGADEGPEEAMGQDDVGDEQTGDPVTAEPPLSEPEIAPEDLDAADGLDRILDTLDEEEVGPEPATEDRPLSLLDLEGGLDAGLAVTSVPVSPIADILARTSEAEPEFDEGFYDDPGIDEEIFGDAGSMDGSSVAPEDKDFAGAEEYDPLEGARAFDEDLFGPESEGEDSLSGSDTDELDPFDAFDGDLMEAGPETEADEGSAGAGAGYDHALPEPTPFGDPTGMGGLFTEPDYPDEVRASDLPETDDDLSLADTDTGTADPVQDLEPTVTTRRVTPQRAEESVLDALMADLNWGGARPEVASEPEATTEVAEEVAAAAEPVHTEADARPAFLVPAFLRPGARHRLGDLSDSKAPQPDQDGTEALAWDEVSPGSDPEAAADGDGGWKAPSQDDDLTRPEPEETDMMTETEPGADALEAEEETTPEAEPARPGRKRLLLGVAAAALLGLGVGGFLLLSAPPANGPAVVVRAPIDQGSSLPPVAGFTPATTDTGGITTLPGGLEPPVSELAGLIETAEPGTSPGTPEGEAPGIPLADESAGETVSGPDTTVLAGDLPITNPSYPVTSEAAVTGSEPDGPDAVAAPSGVPPEIADLMREIGRPDAPSAGASTEQVRALEGRLAELETRLATALDRSEASSSELTGLTDQLTGVMQRNSEQAERIDRMERMIRGQSAILAQVGQMEESLEQTQIVLLDVSSRIGKVEGSNPADRDAVNRALADLESRIQALTANMSILARMSIEGVDALRAPGASSTTAEVRTSPARADEAGGSNTVFRTQQGGFRISSDAAGRVPASVKKDDFIEGYGYVLDVLPASDGQRLVVMENGSVLIPNAD